MKNGLQSYLKENARHGSADFPVGFYAVHIPLNLQNMLVHWHEEMEFTLVRSGTVRYDIDQVRCQLRQGDLLLIGPDTLHSAHQDPGQSAQTDTVVLHLKLAGLESQDGCTRRYVQPIATGALRIPPVVHPGQAHYDELLDCFTRMWECRQPELPYRELEFKAQAFRLVRLIWQLSAGNVPQPPTRTFRVYEDKLKLALAYMQEHYTEAITVRELADLCGFSQVHFMNIFKAAIGSTCIEYLIEYRLARAALDLTETSHSVMQIALDNGFQNISYFNRAFKQQYAMTPTAYRRQPR